MDPLLVDLATARTLAYYGALYAVVIGFAVWIYRDARSEGARYPAAWALATLVFTIVPVVAYMLLKSRRSGV